MCPVWVYCFSKMCAKSASSTTAVGQVPELAGLPIQFQRNLAKWCANRIRTTIGRCRCWAEAATILKRADGALSLVVQPYLVLLLRVEIAILALLWSAST